jgi:hypothetical protein
MRVRRDPVDMIIAGFVDPLKVVMTVGRVVVWIDFNQLVGEVDFENSLIIILLPTHSLHYILIAVAYTHSNPCLLSAVLNI